MSVNEEPAVYPGAELHLIKSFMSEQGVATTAWLLGTGLTPESAFQGEVRLSNRQFDMIHRNIARLLTGLPDAGLRLGSALNISRWGMLTGALLCSSTLGQALATANRFRVLVRSRFHLQATFEGDECVIVIRPVDEGLPVSLTFSLEVLIASLKRQISELLGRPYGFKRIEAPVAERSRRKIWEDYLGCLVTHRTTDTRLILDADDLNLPLALANPVARTQTLKACDADVKRLENLRKGDLIWRIKEYLSAESGRPAATQVADALGLSERTLRRQLQKAGSSYTEVLDDWCMQLAMQALQQPGSRVKAVAAASGYRDITSFREAFRRYTGESPQAYRRLYRQNRVE